jgi:Flp pilus assembly protein CpaB
MVAIKQYSKSDAAALGEDIYNNVNQVIGLSAGSTITKDSVLHSGTDFMQPGTMVAGRSIAGSVTPGMVAVAMEVDQISGVGDLLVPGDHVDVILAMWMDQLKLTVKGAGNLSVEMQGGQRVTSKLIIQDRKILGTLLPSAAAAGGSPQPTGGGQTVIFSGQHMIVILEVQPQEAEVIRYAQREEKAGDQAYLTLSLVLRSDQDTNRHPETTGINFARLVQTYYVLPPDPRGILPADIARSIQW